MHVCSFRNAAVHVALIGWLSIACFAPGVQAQQPPSGHITPDGQLMGPGRGLTGQFEIQFMKFAVDHHFSALRITELAAGTDVQRNAAISPNEGTSPTPGYPFTGPKADLDDLRSMARQANRVQREDILMLQMFLRDWYGISYQPHVTPDGQEKIEILEAARPGKDFDHKFFEVFSRHHFMLMDSVNRCLTGSEPLHPDLARLCGDMWHGQISEIDGMRRELARHFGIVDYQPFKDPRGQHSGSEPH